MRYLDLSRPRLRSPEIPRALVQQEEAPTDWSTFDWSMIKRESFDWRNVDLSLVDWSMVPWREIDFSDGAVSGRDVDWNKLKMDKALGEKVDLHAINLTERHLQAPRLADIEQRQGTIRILGAMARDKNY